MSTLPLGVGANDGAIFPVAPATDAAYTAWAAQVQAQGGVATVWPFSSGAYATYRGQPAARYTVATYTNLFNSGRIDASAPQQTAAAGVDAVYVLAPDAVIAVAPQPPTAVQRAENILFTEADKVTDALGLPSLASVEHGLLILVVSLVVTAAAVVYAAREWL